VALNMSIEKERRKAEKTRHFKSCLEESLQQGASADQQQQITVDGIKQRVKCLVASKEEMRPVITEFGRDPTSTLSPLQQCRAELKLTKRQCKSLGKCCPFAETCSLRAKNEVLQQTVDLKLLEAHEQCKAQSRASREQSEMLAAAAKEPKKPAAAKATKAAVEKSPKKEAEAPAEKKTKREATKEEKAAPEKTKNEQKAKKTDIDESAKTEKHVEEKTKKGKKPAVDEKAPKKDAKKGKDAEAKGKANDKKEKAK